MSIVTERVIKRSNLLITGIQCIVAGIIEWAVVGRFRWYPMYIVNAIALLLLVAGGILCTVTLIRRIIHKRRTGLTVYNAKCYLCAFLQQYRDTNDPDIAGVVNALLVLRKAGLLTITAADKKLSGTVCVQEAVNDAADVFEDTKTDGVVDTTQVHDTPVETRLMEDTLNAGEPAEKVTVTPTPHRRVVRRH